MRKTTFYCDRCGKQSADIIQLGHRRIDTENGYELDHEWAAELCPACFREIDDMVAFMVKNPTIHFDGGKQIEAEPEKSKRTPKKKDLDLGRMAALRNAGWSYEKIAEDLRCSAQTVANRMEEAQAFLRRQNLATDLEEALENDIQEA